MSRSISFSYAQALFQKTSANQDVIQEQLGLLCSILDKAKERELFWKNPFFSYNQKKKMIQDLLNHVDFDKTLVCFIFLLLKKNFFFLREKILNDYRLFIEKNRGELRAVIEFSSAENNESIDSVKKFFDKFFDKKILWTHVHNDRNIAGFTVFIDGQIYDACLSTQLQKIRAKFIS